MLPGGYTQYNIKCVRRAREISLLSGARLFITHRGVRAEVSISAAHTGNTPLSPGPARTTVCSPEGGIEATSGYRLWRSALGPDSRRGTHTHGHSNK